MPQKLRKNVDFLKVNFYCRYHRESEEGTFISSLELNGQGGGQKFLLAES